MLKTFTLTVNGRERKIEADPDMPLLWALRDMMELRGTKFGCGMGLCGACTIHLDGVPTRACITAVSSVGAQKVTTIEGLSPDGRHPVQQAWMEEDVPQCGYCQAGQMMTAAYLVAQRPDSTDEQIVQAMSGNLCRCGTYHRIRRAVRRAMELKRSST
ncbi:MAG TPA: (2Fe-2S)-binding protein [Acidobacteriota bacterium]|nr:(2Fe-2S)-binding protein [Acidobacteriota bacterium]